MPTPTSASEKGGSLKFLMDELSVLENQVDPRLRVYRWRPNQVQLPALYNWLLPSSLAQTDLANWRDTVTLAARIGIRHTEIATEMVLVEEFSDRFRDVMDARFHRTDVLNGAARKATRIDMRTGAEEIGGIPVFFIEFPMTFELNRRIVTS